MENLLMSSTKMELLNCTCDLTEHSYSLRAMLRLELLPQCDELQGGGREESISASLFCFETGALCAAALD